MPSFEIPSFAGDVAVTARKTYARVVDLLEAKTPLAARILVEQRERELGMLGIDCSEFRRELEYSQAAELSLQVDVETL